MEAAQRQIEHMRRTGYEAGFTTAIAADTVPPGLDEGIIRFISAKKDEPAYMLEWRLQAYRQWLTMTEPTWAHVHYPKIDYRVDKELSDLKLSLN